MADFSIPIFSDYMFFSVCYSASTTLLAVNLFLIYSATWLLFFGVLFGFNHFVSGQSFLDLCNRSVVYIEMGKIFTHRTGLGHV